MRVVESSSIYKGFGGCVPFFPQMKPEARTGQAINLNEDEKAILNILKKENKMPLSDLKTQSGLSNKKWDKSIKSLNKNNLTKVEKTEDGLFVSVV